MLYKIVICIYDLLSQDIRKEEALGMRPCKEVHCCSNVNVPTMHNERLLAQVQTLAHWSWSTSDKLSVATMC